jgi:UDP-3-O-[3-hydroxymyristoyl] glucosamine N-acyltransferase
MVTAQSGIPGSVEPGQIVSGSPAIDNKDWLRSTAVFAKLPKIQKAVRDLERRISHLERQ